MPGADFVIIRWQSSRYLKALPSVRHNQNLQTNGELRTMVTRVSTADVRTDLFVGSVLSQPSLTRIGFDGSGAISVEDVALAAAHGEAAVLSREHGQLLRHSANHKRVPISLVA